MNNIVLNDFARQWEEVQTDVLDAVQRVGRSGWYILGREVARFESDILPWFGVTHAIGVANGLDAIEIALRSLELPPGSEVLTTPMSAFATTLAILRAGHRPLFVDTDDRGLQDLDATEEALATHPKIGAVVPVHLFGHPLDLERLTSIADRFPGVKVIEDCAQAHGASWKGRKVGSVGDAAATSFYPTKNMGAMGDGGCILTSNDARATRCRALRDYGQSTKYVHEFYGMNSRLDEVQAAILGSAVLPRLEGWTARRAQIAQRYIGGLGSAFRPIQPGVGQSVWHLFPVVVQGSRDAFMKHLTTHGIQSGIHYPHLITEQKALQDAGGDLLPSDRFPRARALSRQVVSLPIHPHLTDAEIDRVIDVANDWSSV